jgi:predicted Fe-Mo cluster-binding NifX family protein
MLPYLGYTDTKTAGFSWWRREKNPLGDVPDLDAGDDHHRHHHHHMHGIAKYRWLREKVLPDVDVVLAGGACQTSYMYFTSEGMKLLFTEPVEVEHVDAVHRGEPQRI